MRLLMRKFIYLEFPLVEFLIRNKLVKNVEDLVILWPLEPYVLRIQGLETLLIIV